MNESLSSQGHKAYALHKRDFCKPSMNIITHYKTMT